ncbi:hypothetical protein ACQYWQ_12355 [Streptomyces sp. P6-2-1]|uniref:hypothetical protein n=1 Tax=Streptomyces sp. P6-2-1 TaxID=3422591 RepID=UPI003D369706
MSAVPAPQHLRVPVGPDADRWATLPTERTLVVAARTVTSTTRALEALPAILHGDPRVSVVFAHDPGSAFGDGVLDLLHHHGCRVMPWSQLAECAPDLILSASENIEVPAGDCPVLVLPHGVGFQKLVPDARAPGRRLSGLVPDALLASGRAWLTVSHPDQAAQLRAAHPGTAGRTLLVGDPCYDELRRNLPHAAHYRRILTGSPERDLLLISSTWGPTSLLGRRPRLAAELLAALPYDEYRVAAVVHPNVWSAHGAWQLRHVLAPARAAGLLLVPAAHAWRSALVGASLVVGDHGSVTLLGAALGKPVLLGAYGSEAVPGTAGALLSRTAPHLPPDATGRRLRDLIAAARENHTPDRYAAVAEAAFTDPGEAADRLRAIVYRLLRLPPPRERAPVLALPDPAPPTEDTAATSWHVTATLHTPAHQPPAVHVHRTPAAALPRDAEETEEAGYAEESGQPARSADTTEDPYGDEDGYEDEIPRDRTGARAPLRCVYLACDSAEPDLGRLEHASVVAEREPAAHAAEACLRTTRLLDRLPGAILAVVPLHDGGCLAHWRDGRLVEVAPTSPGEPPDPQLLAAVSYATTLARLYPGDLEAPTASGPAPAPLDARLHTASGDRPATALTLRRLPKPGH